MCWFLLFFSSLLSSECVTILGVNFNRTVFIMIPFYFYYFSSNSLSSNRNQYFQSIKHHEIISDKIRDEKFFFFFLIIEMQSFYYYFYSLFQANFLDTAGTFGNKISFLFYYFTFLFNFLYWEIFSRIFQLNFPIAKCEFCVRRVMRIGILFSCCI